MAPLSAHIPDCVEADIVKIEENLESDLGRERGDEALRSGSYVITVSHLQEVQPLSQPLRGNGWADTAVKGGHWPSLGSWMVTSLRGEAVLLGREADTWPPLEGEIVAGFIITAVAIIRFDLIRLTQS